MHKLALPVLLVLVPLCLGPKAMSIETRVSPSTVAIVPSQVMNDDYEDGKNFIEKMCSGSEAMNNYSSAYEMLVYKSQQTVKETGTFSYKKPRLMRVEVQTGPKKGSVAILALDGKVHGHLGGALKFFRATLSPDSELVRALNGFPMAGTDFYSLSSYVRNMLKEGDQSRVSKTAVQTNRTSFPTYVLDLYSTKFGKELLLKRVYVDPHTLLPVFWEDYIDGKIWSESGWHDLKTDVEFPENFFKP